MALEFANITFDLSDQLGVDFDPRRTKVWITTNVPNDTVIDQTGNKIRLGSGNVTVNPDGTGQIDVWKVGQTGLNPLSWQTTVHVDYPDRNERGGRGRRDFGPFTIASSGDLAVLVAEQEVPPTYVSQVTAQLDAKVTEASGYADDAAASAAQAKSVAEIDTSDALVTNLFTTPGTDLNTAATATIAAVVDKTGAVAGDVATYDAVLGKFKPAAPTGGSGGGTITTAKHLGAVSGFFRGISNGFVTGQATTRTTVTSAVSAGATVLPVASATGILAGMSLVLNRATANQQIVTVASVAGSNVTLNETLTNGLASGAYVEPLWVNVSHLTSYGYDAYAYWVAKQPALAGVGNGKVTFLGNSWFDSQTAWATQMSAKFPAATVVNVGVAGNTSANLLARFDTDVPADSDYVIFNEPGVNDILYTPDTRTVVDNLVALIKKIEAIGAIPIYLGGVPHTDNPALATQRATIVDRDPVNYAGVAGSLAALAQYGVAAGSTANTAYGASAQAKQPTGTRNTGFGNMVQDVLTTGGSNTAVGSEAQGALTTGTGNTSIGDRALRSATTAIGSTAVGLQALQAVTTASGATGIGYQACFNLTTGTDNTALGAQAMLNLSTGGSNTAIGRDAGYNAAGVTANATTTGNRQTLVGKGSGQASATQVDDITAVGYYAVAGAVDATALGSQANAGHARSVALGSDTATTAADQVAIGARHMLILNTTAAAAPNGSLFMEGGALKFKGGSGTVTTVAPA